ncbi:MAG: hypothetical protein ACI9P7_002537 [Candidatus Azotimanducaceae bacterium]|jgi:hypothetical protein
MTAAAPSDAELFKTYPKVLLGMVCWPFVWTYGRQVLISLSPHEQAPSAVVFYGVILGVLAMVVSMGLSMVKLSKRNVKGLVGVSVNLIGLGLVTLFPWGPYGI